MSKGKPRYSNEFKNTVVELYNNGKSLSELNSEYGVAKSTISTWVKASTPIIKDINETMTFKELKELKKEMAKLREENEILKKAMAIFAKK